MVEGFKQEGPVNDIDKDANNGPTRYSPQSDNLSYNKMQLRYILNRLDQEESDKTHHAPTGQ